MERFNGWKRRAVGLALPILFLAGCEQISNILPKQATSIAVPVPAVLGSQISENLSIQSAITTFQRNYRTDQDPAMRKVMDAISAADTQKASDEELGFDQIHFPADPSKGVVASDGFYIHPKLGNRQPEIVIASYMADASRAIVMNANLDDNFQFRERNNKNPIKQKLSDFLKGVLNLSADATPVERWTKLVPTPALPDGLSTIYFDKTAARAMTYSGYINGKVNVKELQQR